MEESTALDTWENAGIGRVESAPLRFRYGHDNSNPSPARAIFGAYITVIPKQLVTRAVFVYCGALMLSVSGFPSSHHHHHPRPNRQLIQWLDESFVCSSGYSIYR